MNDDEKRIVQFRPRRSDQPASPIKQAGQQTPQNVSGREEAHRRRQVVNLAAALFAVFLTALGVWLATSLNHMRQVQDCVAMGIRDCSDNPGSAPRS